MMSTFRKYVILGFLIFGTLSLFCLSVTAETLWVDDDYHYPEESDGTLSKPYVTIQSAIDSANNGDVIKILPGTYNEDIVIDKSVSLRTDSVEDTIITSHNKVAYLVNIQANDVSIERFTLLDETNTSHRKAVFYIAPGVQDVVISENYVPSTILSKGVLASHSEGVVIRDNIFNHSTGIQFENCLSGSIADNTISNISGYPGITIIDSTGTVVADNTIENAMNGVYVLSSRECNITSNIIQNHTLNGIYLEDGNSHEIKENYVRYNGLNGIKLTCSDSNIVANKISSNLNGVTVDGDGNKIHNNTIQNNNNYGIYTGQTSHNNIIFANRFSTDEDAILAFEVGDNEWDYNGIGNFWTDYLGPDNDENGIGDIPYNKNNVIDHYPTGKFHHYPMVSDPDPEQLAEEVDLHPTLSVTVDDMEDDRLDVSFYYILDNKSYLIDTVTNVESGKRASVAFYSTIQGQNAVYTYLGAGYDYIGVWYVNVTDTYSTTTSDSWVFSTKHVPVDNDPPTSVIICSDTAETDEPTLFDGSNSIDADGTIAFYRWSFGDGLNIINDKNPTHQYTDPGVYNVSLVVIDNNGSSASSTKQVIVSSQQNDPPTAVVNGPYFAKSNTYMAFSSSGSVDPDPNDELTYEWSFGDGNTSSEENPTYKYRKSGNYTVTLTVTDDSGVSHSSSTYALITKQKEENTPGFELLFFIVGIMVMIFLQNKKRKIK